MSDPPRLLASPWTKSEARQLLDAWKNERPSEDGRARALAVATAVAATGTAVAAGVKAVAAKSAATASSAGAAGTVAGAGTAGTGALVGAGAAGAGAAGAGAAGAGAAGAGAAGAGAVTSGVLATAAVKWVAIAIVIATGAAGAAAVGAARRDATTTLGVTTSPAVGVTTSPAITTSDPPLGEDDGANGATRSANLEADADSSLAAARGDDAHSGSLGARDAGGPASPVAQGTTKRTSPEAAQPTASAPHEAPAFATQLATLDEVRAVLRRGDPGRALVLLDAFDRAHPGSDFAEESLVLRVDALGKSGNRTRAVELARAFVSEHPTSPYAARMKKLANAEP